MKKDTTKIELYFPLTVWDKERKVARPLTSSEKAYKRKIISDLTNRFGAVIITKASGTYKRDNQTVKTKSKILTILMMDRDNELADLNYIESLVKDIKDTLHQEEVILTIDKSVVGFVF